MSKYLKIIFVGLLLIFSILVIFYRNTYLAFMVMFFTPGYFLLSLVYKGSEQMSGWLRAIVSFGISSILTALLGILNAYFFNFPMQWVLGGSSFLLGINVLINSFIVSGQEGQTRGYNNLEKVNPWTVLKIIGILFGVFAFGQFAFIAIDQVPEYSEFYFLKDGKITTDFPTEIKYGEVLDISVGIFNHEEENPEYSIVVFVNDQPNQVFHPIAVGSGQRVEVDVKIENLTLGKDQRIDIFLGNANYDYPYEQLRFWLNVIETE
jgi:uncharacterized membrane protein